MTGNPAACGPAPATADELIDYKAESIRDRVRALTGGKAADGLSTRSGAMRSTRRCAPVPRVREEGAAVVSIRWQGQGA